MLCYPCQVTGYSRVNMQITERKFSPTTALRLIREGQSAILAKVYAGRGITSSTEVEPGLSSLIPYSLLKGAEEMAMVLADAISANKRLVIVADYDADGATACSVALLALRAFGANVGYLIPNRLEHGYGLTPEIAEIACNLNPKPDYLITVDNGISSMAGVEVCNSHGVPVLVTDHHLPGSVQPNARVIVNPNQHGCSFPSKNMAGCGVIFYVMCALQDELVHRNMPIKDESFDVTQLLPLVAVGTVADVVALDQNNRILVKEGLNRIRKGHCQYGIEMLARVANKDPRLMTTGDIAFGIGPRINAAGRLEDMDSGVECLTTDLVSRADFLAKKLHEINDRRKEIEGEMTEEAIAKLLAEVRDDRYTAVLHSEEWHQGVIGIVAGRLKERIWRPTFILANGNNGEYKGSGRSIPGFHLRDALDLVDKRAPGVMAKFGGHAMAAGLTLNPGKLQEFAETFEAVAREMLTPADLNQVLETDGALDVDEMTLDIVTAIKEHVWGQGFPEPVFSDEFEVVNVSPIADGKHIRMTLRKEGVTFEAVKFRHMDGLPRGRVKIVFKMDSNTYRDNTRLQILVDHIEQR